MASTPLLTALYYPYSRTLHPASLRKAVLLFDELVFLDTQPWFMRKTMIREEHSAAGELVEEDYDYLRKQGVLKVIDPTPYLVTYDEILTANVRQDIAADDFLKLAVTNSAAVWSVLRDRLPPSFLKAFYAGAGTFSDLIQ